MILATICVCRTHTRIIYLWISAEGIGTPQWESALDQIGWKASSATRGMD